MWRRWGRRKRAGGRSSTNQTPSGSGLASPCAAFCPRSPLAEGSPLTLQTQRLRSGTGDLRPRRQYTALTAQTWVCQTLQPGSTGRQPLPGRRVGDQTEASHGGNGGGQRLGREALGWGPRWPCFQPLLLRQPEEACGLAHVGAILKGGEGPGWVISASCVSSSAENGQSFSQVNFVWRNATADGPGVGLLHHF